MKKSKNRIMENPTNAIIVVVSIAAFIIGIYAVGFWLSLICVGGLNVICFWKQINEVRISLLKKKNKDKKEKPPKLKKSIDKPVYEAKIDDSIVTVKDNDMKKGKKKTEKKKKTWLVRIFQCLLILGCLGFITAIGAGIWFVCYIVSSAPEFVTDDLYSTEPSTLYYANGDVMATIGTQKRTILTYDELPEVMVNALVAVEDSKFFQHNGIDLQRFLWASIQQVAGRDAGGASTLTMQLSKNYILKDQTSTGWEGIKRKFTDVYMAVFKLEPTYTKEEILAFYINSGQLGDAYGVEAAARTYFNKSAKEINVSEAALLAGMYQAPDRYNPFKHPERAEARRKTALYLMHRHGYISDQEYEIALKLTVDKIVKQTEDRSASADEMDDRVRSAVDTVVKEVKDKTGKDPRLTSMKIYTTFDKKMQLHVGSVFTGQYKDYKWENDKVQGGVAVVNVKTGALVAVGGNRDNKSDGNFNHATEINYQIGSTAKPLFDYAPAIEYMNWSSGTLLADEPYTYSDGKKVNNWDGSYKGLNTIRYHIIQSRNIPALKTFQANDPNKIRNFVKSLGLNPESQYFHEAHAIGGYNGENPLSMASAYAAFANGGYYTAPFTFTKLVYANTGETYTNKSATKQVMSDSTAYIITSILQDTASTGLGMGTYKNVNGIKYAGKTGTTNYDDATKKANKLPSNAVRDLWVAGYNTEYSIAVWYGYDSVKHGYNKLGSTQNSRLFQAVAKGVFTNGAVWKMPDSVSSVTIETDSVTLMLPSENTPAAYKRTELFVKGTEPTTVSPRFAKLSDVTNLQAIPGYGSVILNWTPISTPDAFNFELIKSQSKSAYGTESALNGWANYLIGRNKAILGTVGYNVYIETPMGLELLGWTSDPTFTVTGYSGTNTYVVKTVYSIFKTSISDGRRISATS